MVKNNHKTDKLLKYARLMLFSLAGLFMVLFVYIAIPRMLFPYDLEWAEGAALLQVKRILSAKGLYGPPDINFSPLVYPPVYYYLSAMVSNIVGEGFFALRLVSVVACLGSIALIAGMVYRETENGLAAWLSGMLYVACYQLSDGFYDLARADSLFVFALLAILALWRGERRGWGLMLGLLIPGAFFIKQTAILVFLPLIVYQVLNNFKRSILFALILGIGLSVPIWIWDQTTEDWFTYYIFHLPRQHGYSLVDAVNFWVGDTLRPLGITFAMAGLLILSRMDRRGSSPPNRGVFFDATTDGDKAHTIYILFFLGCLLGSWVTRASNGGAANNVMPTYAGLAVLFGLSYSDLDKRLNDFSQGHRQLKLMLLIVVGIQFFGLLYNPYNYLPNEVDRAANQKLAAFIEEEQDEVFIPYRSHLPTFAGKETHIHIVSLFELLGYFHGQVQPAGRRILDKIKGNICDQEYGAIVLDQPVPWIERELERYYRKMEPALLGEVIDQKQTLNWQRGFYNIYLPDERIQEGEGCPVP